MNWNTDDWYADHLDGRCGCSDDEARCDAGVALWRLREWPGVPLPAAGLWTLASMSTVPTLFLN